MLSQMPTRQRHKTNCMEKNEKCKKAAIKQNKRNEWCERNEERTKKFIYETTLKWFFPLVCVCLRRRDAVRHTKLPLLLL